MRRGRPTLFRLRPRPRGSAEAEPFEIEALGIPASAAAEAFD
jgi:hypothetical protein